jgi:translation elongation factor EF-G
MVSLDPARTALVAIDMHRGHLDPAVATLPLAAERCDLVIARAARLFGELRAHRVPIVHVVTEYRDAQEILANPFWRAIHDDPTKARKRMSGHNIIGEPTTEMEPKSNAHLERLNAALSTLVTDHSALGVSTDPESGQIILNGMSEQHLEDRGAAVDFTHKKHLGPKYDFARVKIEVRPTPRGTPFAFQNSASKSAVPNEYIPGFETGLTSVLSRGVVAGFPVVDIAVTLVDGAYHEVDSSPHAFEIAARMALREALTKAGGVLLEPIMKVEVVTPEEYTGSVIGDLNSRRGEIQSQDMRGNANVVTAMVPLADMLSYLNSLNSMSQGRATASMQFDHYAPVPLPEDNPPFRPAAAMRA